MKFLSVRNGASGPLELNYSNWGLPRIIKKRVGPSLKSTSGQAHKLVDKRSSMGYYKTRKVKKYV